MLIQIANAFFLFTALLFVAVILMTILKTFSLTIARLTYLRTVGAALFCFGSLLILDYIQNSNNRDWFPKPSHDEIKAIYAQNRIEWTADQSTRLISLDGQCHPSEGCACWIAVDIDGSGGMKTEQLGMVWHDPIAKLISSPKNTRFKLEDSPLGYYVGRVSIAQIDRGIYSLMACEIEGRA